VGVLEDHLFFIMKFKLLVALRYGRPKYLVAENLPKGMAQQIYV